jgi:hypothetical protein
VSACQGDVGVSIGCRIPSSNEAPPQTDEVYFRRFENRA